MDFISFWYGLLCGFTLASVLSFLIVRIIAGVMARTFGEFVREKML
jgi:hypothetical protein